MKKFLPVLLIAFAGCLTLPAHLKYPSKAGNSVLGVSITLRAPIAIFSDHPSAVYFAKIEKGETHRTAKRIFTANFVARGRAYLVDCEPGEYVAVAAYTRKQIVKHKKDYSKPDMTPAEYEYYCALFGERIVAASRVSVGKNDFVFMGDYVVDLSVLILNTGTVDLTSANYLGLVKFPDSPYHYLGDLKNADRGPEAAARYYRAAAQEFAESGWSPLVGRHLPEPSRAP
ncbi:MAG TPA: hypothetical protein PLG31_08290 [Spirochaetota bacterium]|nr:hypothetical protein [Spirochaetota bacterium]